MRTFLAALIVIPAAGGCARSAVPTDPGVTSLVLSNEPRISIGSREAPDPHVLSGITDAVRLSTGGLVVASCGTSELQYFDANGRHVRSAGGRGEDPGEFRRSIGNMFPAGGDTVAVVEDILLAYVVHFFDGEGNHVRSQQLASGARPVGRLDDGRLVAVRWDSHISFSLGASPPERTPGIDTITATLLTVNSSGAAEDSVPGLFAAEGEIDAAGRRFPLRFRRQGRAVVFPDRIVYGDQLGPTADVYDPALQRIRRFTVGEPGVPVTSDDRERWDRDKESQVPLGSRRFPVFSRFAAPVRPAYGDIVAGRDGGLWVQDAKWLSSYPLTWTRYLDGRPVARAQLPPRFFPFEFGADWVLGVRFEHADAEVVELYGMVSGPFSQVVMPHRTAAVPHVVCGARHSR